MSKGKRELIIEVAEKQFTISDFRNFVEKKLKEAGYKYSDDIKMYLNNGIVYCVDNTGKQYRIEL